jgi:hypothetical protein
MLAKLLLGTWFLCAPGAAFGGDSIGAASTTAETTVYEYGPTGSVGVELGIAIPSSTVSSRSRFSLYFSLRNSGTADSRWYITGPLSVSFADSAGRKVDFEESASDVFSLNSDLVRLKPGAVDLLPFSDYYTASTPGNYSATATEVLYDGHRNVVARLRSGSIHFTVVGT